MRLPGWGAWCGIKATMSHGWRCCVMPRRDPFLALPPSGPRASLWLLTIHLGDGLLFYPAPNIGQDPLLLVVDGSLNLPGHFRLHPT